MACQDASDSSKCGVSLSNSYGVKTNLIVDDVEEVISELKLFKQAGGGTLCDISPVGVRSVLFSCTSASIHVMSILYVQSETWIWYVYNHQISQSHNALHDFWVCKNSTIQMLTNFVGQIRP